MSDRGFIAVDRAIFEHPMFAAEPFTEREAWLWLIAEAAWKPTRTRVGKAVIDLDRGQLAHSLRFIAARWRWSEPRVRRFLARLKTDAMIDAQATRDATQITICNFDRFQSARRTSETESDAPTDALATQSRTREQASSLRSEASEKKPQARGSRLPTDWQPSEADWLASREAGLNDLQSRREAESFRDYWHSKPGKDALKLDWPATWRNWCRRAAERLPRKDPRHEQSRSPQRRSNGHDALAAALFGDQPSGFDDDPRGQVVSGRDEPGGKIVDLAPDRSVGRYAGAWR
jgi:hypothetical protein